MTSSLDVFRVDATTSTTWIFFRLTGSEGETGIGEATRHGHGEDVLAALSTALATCERCSLGLGAKLSAIRNELPGFIGNAIASALEQAWLDRLGKISGQPLHALLGGRYRAEIPTYANINRGTITRQPAGFAERAQAAIDAGYKAIKLAPFDGISPDACGDALSNADGLTISEADRAALFQHGIARVAAVSSQFNGQADIYVDCHSRLRMSEARDTLEQMAELGVRWFEEPIPETAEHLDQIAKIRKHANTKDMLLAGAEKSSGVTDILAFLGAGCYDVLMPDIILAGGPLEVIRIGHLAKAHNSAISLHNPCGPIMDIMCAQVATALPNLHSMERQVNESPLYDEIVLREHSFDQGSFIVSDSAGAGCTLLSSHPDVNHVATYTIDI